MAAESGISLNIAALGDITGRIPSTDFIDRRYDRDYGVKTTSALVILSTPRSGSTLLCELLRLNDACLAHEYFQPAQYMPILANRWNCMRGDVLDEAAFVRSLRKHRTYPNGCLGINLHGSHLRYFAKMEGYLHDLRVHYVHLVRRSVIPQAVSYHIASQTRQWSSEFKRETAPEYDYGRIQRRLQRINGQNALIQAFLIARQAECQTLYYEDLIADPERTLRRVPAMADLPALNTQPGLQRQAGRLSEEWTQRFSKEFLARDAAQQDDTDATRAQPRSWLRRRWGS